MKKKKTAESVYAHRESVVFSDFTDRNKRRHSIKTMLIVVSVIVILLVFVILIVHKFFRVKDIVVDGVSYYDYATILEKAEVEKGQIIFGVSEKTVREKLIAALPHVRSVELELRFPSGVYIEIEEEVPAYYFEMAGEYFVINEEMKVLDRFLTQDKLLSVYPDLMAISIPEVSSAITAQKVLFVTEFSSKHTDDALYALRHWERFDQITEINLENRFELSICYQDRILVKFGSYTDFSGKLRLLEEMIDYYDGDVHGTFSVSDVEKGIAWIDKPEDGNQNG
ncbi:MAG: cell division protein FtsQ/DivIB [Eubacteriales bacterium]